MKDRIGTIRVFAELWLMTVIAVAIAMVIALAVAVSSP